MFVGQRRAIPYFTNKHNKTLTVRKTAAFDTSDVYSQGLSTVRPSHSFEFKKARAVVMMVELHDRKTFEQSDEIFPCLMLRMSLQIEAPYLHVNIHQAGYFKSYN